SFASTKIVEPSTAGDETCAPRGPEVQTGWHVASHADENAYTIPCLDPAKINPPSMVGAYGSAVVVQVGPQDVPIPSQDVVYALMWPPRTDAE
ncbi:MAG: hypothetical protein ACRDH7_03890, partial [Actinomycetota bacterium]